MRHVRKKKGLNQIEFARRVGVAQSTLSRIEMGTAVPDAVVFREIAAQVGMTADQLYRTVDETLEKARTLAAATDKKVEKAGTDVGRGPRASRRRRAGGTGRDRRGRAAGEQQARVAAPEAPPFMAPTATPAPACPPRSRGWASRSKTHQVSMGSRVPTSFWNSDRCSFAHPTSPLGSVQPALLLGTIRMRPAGSRRATRMSSR
ncbi:MAG: helix-turn-helix transcriptional regulator [Deltaproteobacteria bacterium]|nr:helix-turn-helix transcriptional regulator [Deltaproteobacteria bacterium]